MLCTPRCVSAVLSVTPPNQNPWASKAQETVYAAQEMRDTPAGCSKPAARATPKGPSSLQRSTGPFPYHSLCRLSASDAQLVRFLNDFCTSGVENLQFDAKINIAGASLSRKSHQLCVRHMTGKKRPEFYVDPYFGGSLFPCIFLTEMAEKLHATSRAVGQNDKMV